jgi:DegV family protein with EDD domain
MWLTVDGAAFREGERSLGELLGDSRVTTSAPTPGEFAEVVRAQLEGGADRVVVLTIASSMSASHHAATVAARELGDAVRVVDTMTASGGQALVVLAAAECAAAGGSADDVVKVAGDVASRVRLVATVPDLGHLVRSGRVPGIAGWAGRTLGISPLFELQGGHVHRLRPALSTDAAFDRVIARFRRSGEPGSRAHVVALHALAPDAADRLLQRAVAVADTRPVESFVSELGSVMVVHVGPGVVGLAWWWEPTPP